MNTQNSWTLREILIVAAIGATFGFLYLGWVQVWQARPFSAPSPWM
jgi:energy-coupling factor transport system substrate-specific component